jgi:hypothetical protein
MAPVRVPSVVRQGLPRHPFRSEAHRSRTLMTSREPDGTADRLPPGATRADARDLQAMPRRGPEGRRDRRQTAAPPHPESNRRGPRPSPTAHGSARERRRRHRPGTPAAGRQAGQDPPLLRYRALLESRRPPLVLRTLSAPITLAHVSTGISLGARTRRGRSGTVTQHHVVAAHVPFGHSTAGPALPHPAGLETSAMGSVLPCASPPAQGAPDRPERWLSSGPLEGSKGRPEGWAD